MKTNVYLKYEEQNQLVNNFELDCDFDTTIHSFTKIDEEKNEETKLSDVQRCEYDALTTDDERINYLNSNNLWYVNVILTFDHHDQYYLYYILKRTENDNDYLLNIFSAMDNTDDVKHLVKISLCHQYSGPDDLPDFILHP